MKPEATPADKRPAAEKAATPSGSKKALIGAGIGLVALAVAYGVGRVQGARGTSAADERAASAAAEREKADKALASERGVTQRLDARRRLHLALIALDERNFGIAEQHVAAAAQLIQKSGAPKDSEVSKLGDELARGRLVATEDVGSQRSKLLGWAKRFDDAMPPAPP